jgi:hypothetical protein
MISDDVTLVVFEKNYKQSNILDTEIIKRIYKNRPRGKGKYRYNIINMFLIWELV